MKYYLAVDIGASSGRHILFWKEADGVHMREVYRFEHKTIQRKGRECWDIEQLLEHVKIGMKRCKEIGCLPVSMAIDTWGVDYVLLDEDGNRIDDCICYRDHGFDHGMEQVFSIVSKEELYNRTGIQFQQFNTIFQLYERKQHIDLYQAKHFLMLPDYLAYELSGILFNEYTNATTTQLINAQTKDWDYDLMEKLQIPTHIFHPLLQPATYIGTLRPQIQKEIGYSLRIMTCASHDTGSAFLVPQAKDSIIISSGTWSLLGVHLTHACISEESMKHNYTNEGGYHTIRFLKNVMGLWLLQELQRDFETFYTFDELTQFAEKADPFDTIIDVDDHRFLKPQHMVHEIDAYCMQHHLRQPKTIGEYVQCICHSLAVAYHKAILELESIQKKTYTSITIIGGGVQNEYLNTWIEKVCHKPVIRGVIEATAYGNAMCQMQADHVFSSLDEARKEALIVSMREEKQ